MQRNVLYNKDIIELSFEVTELIKDFDSFNYPNCYYPYCLLSMIQGFPHPN